MPLPAALGADADELSEEAAGPRARTDRPRPGVHRVRDARRETRDLVRHSPHAAGDGPEARCQEGGQGEQEEAIDVKRKADIVAGGHVQYDAVITCVQSLVTLFANVFRVRWNWECRHEFCIK